MDELFDHKELYGMHYCFQCETTYREGRHYELWLKLDRRVNPKAKPSKEVHVADFCEQCWESWMGIEADATNFLLEDHTLEEYLEYACR